MPAPAISQSATITTTAFTAIGAAMLQDSKINIYIINQTESPAAFSLAIATTAPTANQLLYKDLTIASNTTFVASEVYIKGGDSVYVKAVNNFTVRVDGEQLEVPAAPAP